MRKIIATEYLTLDGIMEAPNKWSFPFWSDETAKFKYDELFASDALLLGKVTYEGFASAWPTMEGTGDFGERMNSIKKYVVSSTLKDPKWNNTQIINKNFIEEIEKLKNLPGKDILLSGSSDLFNALMNANLIDEYRLMIYPIVFSEGKRLFSEKLIEKNFNVVSVKNLPNGVVVITYESKII